MTINQTASAANTLGASGANNQFAQSGADLQNTFMKLLVAQLQNQDPLNPMDNAQLTSQLAQINTVSGISQLNTTMTSLASQNAAAQASSLIGRTVQAPSSSVMLASGSAHFGVFTPNGADDMVAIISDASGNIVRTINLGGVPAGANQFTWDGKNDKGVAVADGPYTIKAMAALAGRTVVANTLGADKVVGVTINNGIAQLQLEKFGAVRLSDITTIQ